MRTQKIKDVHRLLSLMMLVSCFISLAVAFKNFFMVPSVSVLTEFHCLIKSNICQTVMQTACESRTVSWKLTTKQTVMYKNSDAVNTV